MDKEAIISLTQEANKEVAKLLKVPVKKITVSTNMRAIHTHGRCIYNHDTKETKVCINPHLINEEDILTTILHELCHVYATVSAGHGPEWRKIVNIVNAGFNVQISRCSNKQHDNAQPGWIVRCPRCGRDLKHMYKRTKIFDNINNCWCKFCGKDTKGTLKILKVK